ncbi:hypothetical protein NEOLEDRAFT_1131449 [Neolentinus lepideus HHB14362 ss-1]|uniref:Uncharacterized protein n=1 Tax=Neolentinus lepideus HHB14362 ss-1 TaxID=1314782 RepID=A0A165TP29_9AGAM|nr:hypothetical protein NEOLEDRAFT_1131449 [Neolentinus lepideus HHB14362 ss-1]
MHAPLAPATNKTNTPNGGTVNTSANQKQKDKDKQQQPSQAAPNSPPKKDVVPPQQYPQSLSKQPPTQQQQPSRAKKAYRRSSKPIISWLQKKWAGRPRTTSDGSHRRDGKVRGGAARDVSLKRIPSTPSLPTNRNSTGTRYDYRGEYTRPNTISLNGDDDFGTRMPRDSDSDEDGEDNIERSTRRSSIARDSMWSPSSPTEADEDASVRPIPPSGPPSPSPSRSSSSYLSDPRTFRSIAASTKPTTLLSVDLATNGMAHIAQAPPTPISATHPRMPPHRRASSAGGSITFSVLPLNGAQSPSSPSSLLNAVNVATLPRGDAMGPFQAPLHTTHHPRDNPRPSSPPQDDASVLTLASSAFGMPGARIGVNALVAAGLGRTGSTIGAGEDSISRFEVGTADSLSHFVGDDLDRDVNASVRALRPRSSRRGSWESEASEWSAKVGTSMMRDRSFRTSYSARTGALLSGENDCDGEVTIDEDVNDEDGVTQETNTQASTSAGDEVTNDSATEEHLYLPSSEEVKDKEDEEDMEATPHHEPKEITPSASLSPARSQEPETTPTNEEKKDYFGAPMATGGQQRLQVSVGTPLEATTPSSVAPSEAWMTAPSSPMTLA